jgi:hypothetical protein
MCSFKSKNRLARVIGITNILIMFVVPISFYGVIKSLPHYIYILYWIAFITTITIAIRITIAVYNQPLTTKRRIAGLPGARLSFLADIFCSPKTMERVVRPIISDIQAEYFQALAENKKIKAFWVRVRGYWTFWKALGLQTIVKNLVAIWRISRLG